MTLKTRVMMQKIQLCITGINHILKDMKLDFLFSFFGGDNNSQNYCICLDKHNILNSNNFTDPK